MKITTSPEYLSAIASGPISQICENTCQATCVHAVLGGEPSIVQVREGLVSMGQAGDPAVMAEYLHKYFASRYQYEGAASISDMKSWIRLGEVLITHGWFTGSGHVIILDGCDDRGFRAMDPFEEFDGPTWQYHGELQSYQGRYSDLLIYAACVAGNSKWDADAVYQIGAIDLSHKAAWVHRIKPSVAGE